MKSKLKSLALTGLYVVAAATLANGQATTPSPAPADKNVDQPQPGLKPGFDDLMTVLVQPRHIKLHAAGIKTNWELAGFELEELRSAFRRAAEAMPSYQDNDVKSAVETFMEPTLRTLGDAIKTGNVQQFAKGYAEVTAGCNACHTFMEHSFIVIRTPDVRSITSYTDQRFDE